MKDVHVSFQQRAMLPLMLEIALLAGVMCSRTLADTQGLIGYWPIRGDCQDHSGAGRHGLNHGVDLEKAQFNGRSGFIEIPAAGLNLGTSDFTISAWVHTEELFDDVIGDVVSQYDAARRRGLFVGLHNPASVQVYDGTAWKALPNPSSPPPDGTQTHALDVYRGSSSAQSQHLSPAR